MLAPIVPWLRLVDVCNLVDSIFCDTLCDGMVPGLVIVVIVVGIMSVVSIVGRLFAAASQKKYSQL